MGNLHLSAICLNILIYAVIGIILLKMTICIKLETDWAKATAKAIDAHDAAETKKYAHFSRRDSSNLNASQMGSAVIESMSENLIDFKLSPMMSFALFGVTGAIAFRVINTLDGMVGFKTKEHINTGWFSANLDNIVNYIPTRLTALLMIVAAGFCEWTQRTLGSMAKRDHKKTQSRNHGWPMAAVAGALRIQLEKPGQVHSWRCTRTLTGDKILGALRIRDVTIILWGLALRCRHRFGAAVLVYTDLVQTINHSMTRSCEEKCHPCVFASSIHREFNLKHGENPTFFHQSPWHRLRRFWRKRGIKLCIIDSPTEGWENLEELDATKYRVGLNAEVIAGRIRDWKPEVVIVEIPFSGWSKTAFEVVSIAKKVNKDITVVSVWVASVLATRSMPCGFRGGFCGCRRT